MEEQQKEGSSDDRFTCPPFCCRPNLTLEGNFVSFEGALHLIGCLVRTSITLLFSAIRSGEAVGRKVPETVKWPLTPQSPFWSICGPTLRPIVTDPKVDEWSRPPPTEWCTTRADSNVICIKF
jgi:hypothetical protein